jgi:hypothetical protein
MYDMYPWNSADRGATPQDPPAHRGAPRPPGPPLGGDQPPQTPLDAVQFALDRRDNGGDAAAMTDQPSTQPTADRTRQ